MHVKPRRWVLSLCVSVMAAALTAGTAHAQGVLSTSEVGPAGFGDARNSYAWSMAWFKGKLYVGTARSALCVEDATLQFYFPNLTYYTAKPWSDLSCPADQADMDLRAEIWQLTPSTGAWKRVYQSPADIPNPRAPGRFVARDIGYRGMAVVRGPGGKPTLYVGGVTANEYIPELAAGHPPRLLRTTDGESFSALRSAPATIDTWQGPYKPIGYRAMIAYKNRLFVTASGGLTGDGVVLEVHDATGAAPSFTQISPPELQVFELQTFAGDLYAGTGNAKGGYGVYKTDASGLKPTFTPVVVNGAGRAASITSVVSMHVFKRRLYVGASGWYATLFPASELIRIDAGGRWDVVVGSGRFAADGSFKIPISGLPDGFGNIFNAHFWRQQAHDGVLYVGTNDWSWSLRGVPILDPWLRPEFGFDLYGSCDGQYWWPATRNAFGNGLYNFGVRTMASTPVGGFIGSTNHAKGTNVWESKDPSPCGAGSFIFKGSGLARTSRAERPRRLLADVQRAGTVLSWEGLGRSRVLRAAYHVARDVQVPRRPKLPSGFIPTVAPNAATTGTTVADVPVAGPFRRIGRTARGFFVDRAAQPGVRYVYRVVDAAGTSNTVMVPSGRPAVTFAEADAALERLEPARGATLRRLLRDAHRRWVRADRPGALRRLGRIRRAPVRLAHASAAGARAVVEDARDVVLRLERRVRYSRAAGG